MSIPGWPGTSESSFDNALFFIHADLLALRGFFRFLLTTHFCEEIDSVHQLNHWPAGVALEVPQTPILDGIDERSNFYTSMTLPQTMGQSTLTTGLHTMTALPQRHTCEERNVSRDGCKLKVRVVQKCNGDENSKP